MKLIKDLTINIYEVIADYKVKIENAPFIAILKFAEEKGGVITPELLQKELLNPLSTKACENLLKRLINLNYIELLKHSDIDDSILSIQEKAEKRIQEALRELNQIEVEHETFQQNYVADQYKLTNLGYISAQKEEFYDERNGLLKLYVAEENEFIEQRIVKIEEFNRDFDENTKIQDLNYELKSLLGNKVVVNLKNNKFILDKFEPKCKILKQEKHQLNFSTNKEGVTIKMMNFEIHGDYTEQEVKNIILENEFSHDYDSNTNILKIYFDKNKLELQRNELISQPIVSETKFKEVEIKNIKVSPHDIEDARKWHLELLKNQINSYVFTEKEFVEIANNTADKFELFKGKLNNSISRKQFITELDNTKDFYTKAKLETIDFLNY